MENFYLTFGVKHPAEPHPYWTGADGSGWVRITAESAIFAQLIAQQFFGDDWAFIYPEKHFDTSDSRKHFSKGELLHLKQSKQSTEKGYGFVVTPYSKLIGTFKSSQEHDLKRSVGNCSEGHILQLVD